MAGTRRKSSAATRIEGSPVVATSLAASALVLVAVVVAALADGRLGLSGRSDQRAPQLRNNAISAPATRAPHGDLPGWRQVFVEDFDRPVALGRFVSDGYYGPRFRRTYPHPWKDTSGHGSYDPDRTVSVADGVLDTYLHTEGGQARVAAVEPTLALTTRGQTYGRYAVRFRADTLPGYKIAWLLWPDSGLRSEGEIDFPEADLDARLKAFLHQASHDGSPYSLGVQDEYESQVRPTGWHTAVTEWQPGSVQFLLDGEVLGTSTDRVPARPMHWVLQTETRLSGPPPDPSVSGHVQVDWVAAWSYAP